MPQPRQEPPPTKAAVTVILLIALAITLLLMSTYTVGTGQRGVVLTFGNPNQIAMSEGLHFKYPIAQKVVKMDVKTQKYEAPSSSASKDLQVVSTIIAVNYHLTPESVPRLYQEIGVAYQDRVMQPAVQEVVKSATAKFTAEELITKRPLVKEEIETQLKDRLVDRGIIVEEISIVNFDFSESFNTAIEKKVTAEQNALAAKNKLEQIRYESEQAITAAEGQAQAQALLASSVTTDTLEYQMLLNQRAAIDKWDGILPQVTGGATPFIDLRQEAPTQ